MKRYCPYCGAHIEPNQVYCISCGGKIPEEIVSYAESGKVSYPSPPQPPYQQYARRYQPRPFHPTLQASLGDRCFALIIDDCISACISIVSCAVLCLPLGFIYDCLKDGIREGQSLGKGGMNLRVVDFRTGMPATIGQSMVRNCCCGWCDSSTCYIAALFDSNGRRIGDQFAGTVVIKDY